MSDRLCGLPRAATLTHLAHVLFLAQHTFYALPSSQWEDLTVEQKHLYVLLAEEVLGQLKPTNRSTWPQELFQHVASVAREEATKVIGHISPSMPFGESRND